MDDLDPEVGHGKVERATFRLLTIGDILLNTFKDHVFAWAKVE
jgi:hypothetical protein